VPLERFAASWREEYVERAARTDGHGDPSHCVFCVLAKDEVSIDTGVLVSSERVFACLNAYPYGSGHLLVLPKRHVGDLEDMDDDESRDLFALVRSLNGALRRAYDPDGMNIGMNIGRAAGAGIPQHVHAHLLPRWSGDTNFMATIGDVRVLPESLTSTWEKVFRAL